jgi:hypothetical protein
MSRARRADAAAVTDGGDAAASAWLLKRNPEWDAGQVAEIIARTHVIEDNPDWDEARIGYEAARRLRPKREKDGEGTALTAGEDAA